MSFGESAYDELDYARSAARHFGVKLHEYVVTADDIADAAPRIAEAYDEPFGNTSAVAAYYCARLASGHGVTLMLAGDGGDELFAGNERYTAQRIFEAYGRVPRWLRAALEPLLDVMAEIQVRISAYDREILLLCSKQYPETNVLRQVKGVGALVALT